MLCKKLFRKTNISYLPIRTRQIFRKTNISYPLISTRTCAYQGVRNVCFSENLTCFVFLKHPFWDSHFCLINDEFFDAVLLRYGWELKRLPDGCICKAKYNIKHVLTSRIGGFVTLCHNENVNVTQDMISMVCKDVRKESTLSTTPDSNDELRANISMRSFWKRL